MLTDDRSLEQLDRASLIHPFTRLDAHLRHGPLVISEALGTRVRDNQGREYLDAMAGLWCVNVGYGREEIALAIAEQTRQLAFYHSFASMANEPSIRLAARLLERAPSMSKVFFGLSGSDANDTQVKLVWRYNNLRGRPQKKKIISRRNAYHGTTLAAGSLTGLPSVHVAFDLPLPGFLHVSMPHHRRVAPELSEPEFVERLAQELDERIRAEGAETVAAFIAEPVMGAGGVIVPPPGYFERIGEVLRAHDVLLIADEVICGFGRLGRWFGSELFGLEPDLMTLAKGLTSGYLPLSACLVSEPIWQVLSADSDEVGAFAHGFTYSGHPVCAAAALANLDIIEREDLIARAAKRGALLQSRLREACGDHPRVAEVRGVGLIAAIEPEPAHAAPRLYELLLEQGLLTRAIGGTAIALSPPLVVSEPEIEEIVTGVRHALDRLDV